jgi:hypothetical protein
MMSDSTTVNGAVFRPHSYLSDEQGSMICFGTSERAGARSQAMIRFFADGRHDTSFGTNGLREEAFDVSSMRSARNILTPNGKILAIRHSTDFNRVLIQRWHGAAIAPTMSRVLKESLFK